ncbi:PREDICTED: uncharacterized protein LOC105360427 [Ceratosolen solmsi marchali]|uniref:Uncharacterized protein LOC105360427 n=1 Tax=Ceratosolen solmsi marchali TaxID=326594 RepID=A0AAJ6VLU6_9HYME|nr:PREDICTED: uncharacterized protein LOC105360427 [Ceratosolen solmsi marchali]
MSDNIFCSGTLIATYHVLTAEQCFENIGNDPIQIILSTGDLTHGTHTFPLWWISYDMWAHHSRSQITTIYNNIAIIKIFGVTPSLRIAPLSTISPLRLLEGFRAELCGCSVRNANANPIMMQKAEVRILKRETCAHIVSELEGVELVFPDNYICTNANPVVHLENKDKGGPVLFFDSLIAINVGTFPCMEGAYNVNKVNGHITVDHYRVFIYDMLNY